MAIRWRCSQQVPRIPLCIGKRVALFQLWSRELHRSLQFVLVVQCLHKIVHTTACQNRLRAFSRYFSLHQHNLAKFFIPRNHNLSFSVTFGFANTVVVFLSLWPLERGVTGSNSRTLCNKRLKDLHNMLEKLLKGSMSTVGFVDKRLNQPKRSDDPFVICRDMNY